MIVPEERRHWSKERRSNRSNYCQSDSHDRRRHNTAAAARHSSRRIGGHPDWHFRSSGTPCSPSSSEQDSSLDERPDEGPASPRGAKYLPGLRRNTKRLCRLALFRHLFWPHANNPALHHALKGSGGMHSPPSSITKLFSSSSRWAGVNPLSHDLWCTADVRYGSRARDDDSKEGSSRSRCRSTNGTRMDEDAAGSDRPPSSACSRARSRSRRR